MITGKRIRHLALTCALCLALPGMAAADRAADLVFSTGVLGNIPAEKAVSYDHLRLGPESEEFHSIPDGRISLGVVELPEGGREAVMAMFDDGKARNRTPFPADAGNPLVMAFLESSLRSMAQITGGSPFYLRNRIKEALRSGGEVTPVRIEVDGAMVDASQVTFRPFVEDQNAARMGDFSGLELTFVVSESVPGGFILFSALTPETDGTRIYQETMRYSSLIDQE